MRESYWNLSSTEGASLPANLSGLSTASNWPLWKSILLRKLEPTVKVTPHIGQAKLSGQ
jgi:hypothetical protein